MPPIQNRYDFVYLFDVTDGNPNGDPDAGNQPRVDPETGEGLVTDVCLKRKIRNFVSLAERDAGKPVEENGMHPPRERFDIYVKERGILAHEQRRAYAAVRAEPGDRPNELARRWMCQTFYDVRTFGAVMTTGKVDDTKAPAGKPKKDKAKPPPTALTEAASEFQTTEEAGASEFPAESKKSEAKEPKKKQWNCGQVRGPVQMTFARSVTPIVSLEHAITRVALTNASDTNREASGEEGEKASTGQMGRKMTVPYGLYVCRGFVSPQLAADTGFTEEDLQLLWRALARMFEFDRSATRGQMSARGLYIFRHDSKLGNAASHALQDRVTAKRKDGVAVARGFGDFAVGVNRDGLPRGVELVEYDCETFADEPAAELAAAS